MSIPVGYRSELEGDSGQPPFITSEGPLLRIYPHELWRDREKDIVAGMGTDPSANNYARLVLSSAEPLPIDKQGRALVPPRHRRSAGLTKQVSFAGVGNFIELWDTDALDAVLSETEANFDSVSREMDGKLRS